jgi:hypothetical protein
MFCLTDLTKRLPNSNTQKKYFFPDSADCVLIAAIRISGARTHALGYKLDNYIRARFNPCEALLISKFTYTRLTFNKFGTEKIEVY